MKRKKIILIMSGVIVVGVIIGGIVLATRENIELKIEGNKAIWIDKSRKNNEETMYELFNDEFSVVRTKENGYFITSDKLIDEHGPKGIKKFKIAYTDDKIDIRWDEIEDRGSKNKINVGLYNERGRKLGYSNKVDMNYASGIYKYVVDINGEEYEAVNRELVVNMGQLKDGITKIKVYAIDKRGNKGDIAEIPLYNFKIDLKYENNILKYDLGDKTQKYDLEWYVNGAKFDNDVTKIMEMIVDNSAPEGVKNVRFNSINKKVSLNWDTVKDAKSVFDVSVRGKGEKYGNQVKSNDVKIDKTSGIKGYKYAFNKVKEYVVTEGDIDLAVNSLEVESEYGEFYFHIASIDTAGNISATKTIDVSVKEPIKEPPSVAPPVEEKPEVVPPTIVPPTVTPPTVDPPKPPIGNDRVSINNYLEIDKNIPASIYKKVTSHVSGLGVGFREKIGNGVKIYITSGEAEDLYRELTGRVEKGINVKLFSHEGKVAVIFEEGVVNEKLLITFASIVDKVLGNGSNISQGKSFGMIRNEEMGILYGDEVLDDIEYFKRSYVRMFEQREILKESTPKTFWFIYNRIFV